jgi:hypothetical protein
VLPKKEESGSVSRATEERRVGSCIPRYLSRKSYNNNNIIIICLFSVTQQYMGTIEIKAEECTVILFMMVVEDPIRETAEAQWLGIHRHIC